MKFSVVVTEGFKKHVKRIAQKYPSLKSDLLNLISSLETNPKQGISIGKSCYKIRLAISSKGKGKSGGSRVITCVQFINQTVYLLTIYDKSDKDSLSDYKLNKLLRMAGL